MHRKAEMPGIYALNEYCGSYTVPSQRLRGGRLVHARKRYYLCKSVHCLDK